MAEDRVLATAQHIVNSLNISNSKDATDDMLSILSTFDNRFLNISSLMNPPPGDLSTLESAEQLILRPDSAQQQHLDAIDDVLLLMEDLRFQQNSDAMDRAEKAVQFSVARLQDDFRSLLANSAAPLDVDRIYGNGNYGNANYGITRRVSLSFVENGGEEGIVEDFECVIGEGGEEEEEDCGGSGKRGFHERGRSLAVSDVFVDLIKPDVILELKEIAKRMIRAGYEKECCQIFSSVRRGVLDEYLASLGVDRVMEDDEMMKKWIKSLKVMMKVIDGERRLCEEVFEEESDLIKEVCFVEMASGCVLKMMRVGGAVAGGSRSAEKLFRILDMYEALEGAMGELRGLFVDESGEVVCGEARGVLERLGETARETFRELEESVKGECSKKPTHGAEIHPLTRWLMNYVRLLVDYSDTLDSVLEAGGDGEEDGVSPLARIFLSLIASLELNLEEKAKMYESAMQCVFLMNNKLYIVQKVKDSDLAKILGDDWVRRRRGHVRKYATSYLRASWSKALSCLRDEGLSGSGNTSASKMALKEKFKSFNAVFEEIYRVQTGWRVADSQLRTELRISIFEKVIPAYRAFLGRFGSQLESGRHAGRYIKYSAEDIEGYVGDLFEGKPAVVNQARR